MRSRSVPELQCTQEETNTKMFLCASFAGDLGFSSVNIVTVDSDVGILALYYQSKLDVSICLEMGTSSKIQIFDISSNSVDSLIREALPSLHALSGCDSTSCFSGIGKGKCLKVLQSNERFIDAVSLLGKQEYVSNPVAENVEEYVCALYGINNEPNIYKARYRLFTRKKRLPDPQKLPPMKDTLLLHFARANYQAHETSTR